MEGHVEQVTSGETGKEVKNVTFNLRVLAACKFFLPQTTCRFQYEVK
jgi:hypothetical protein